MTMTQSTNSVTGPEESTRKKEEQEYDERKSQERTAVTEMLTK
jgi:hypothetical protein